MKYLKPFIESKIESETDASDYLLELVDEEFLFFNKLEFKHIWDSSGNNVVGNKIHYVYLISEDFKKINNNKKLEAYINKLSRLSNIIKRWGLGFSIFRDELTIIGEAPDYISEFAIKNKGLLFSYSDRNYVYYGSNPSISCRFNANLEFFISVRGTKKEIETYIKNEIKFSEKYKLKLTKESSGECEFQIVPI